MQRFFTRHQAQQSPRAAIVAGIGGLISIGAVGALTVISHTPLIMAPFGASCVLIFSIPSSPLSQPANVIGGHVLATLVGLVLRFFLPDMWWAGALAVGLAIALMAAFRVTHPPAGADPLVVFAADPGFGFLISPVFAGAVILVTVAMLFHKASGAIYPIGKT